MSNQLTLPFAHWKFPEAHARLIAVANAGPSGTERYSPFWRDRWKLAFYSLKTRLLQEHAIPDGFDIQILTLGCRGCHKGIWYSEYSNYSDVCYRCGGTGVFRRDAVKLTRWNLSGLIFHCPADRIRGYSEDDLTEWRAHAIGEIKGKIEHAEVDEKHAVSAFLKLLKIYDRPAYDRLLEGRMEEWLLRVRTRALSPINRIYWRVRRWLENSDSRWADGLREWFGILDVPF